MHQDLNGKLIWNFVSILISGMALGMVGYTKALAFLPVPRVWAILFFICIILVNHDSAVYDTFFNYALLIVYKTNMSKQASFDISMLPSTISSYFLHINKFQITKNLTINILICRNFYYIFASNRKTLFSCSSL